MDVVKIEKDAQDHYRWELLVGGQRVTHGTTQNSVEEARQDWEHVVRALQTVPLFGPDGLNVDPSMVKVPASAARAVPSLKRAKADLVEALKNDKAMTLPAEVDDILGRYAAWLAAREGA